MRSGGDATERVLRAEETKEVKEIIGYGRGSAEI